MFISLTPSVANNRSLFIFVYKLLAMFCMTPSAPNLTPVLSSGLNLYKQPISNIPHLRTIYGPYFPGDSNVQTITEHLSWFNALPWPPILHLVQCLAPYPTPGPLPGPLSYTWSIAWPPILHLVQCLGSLVPGLPALCRVWSERNCTRQVNNLVCIQQYCWNYSPY